MRHRPTEANRMTTTTQLDKVRPAVPCHLRIVGEGASAHLYWSINEGWRQGEPAADCLTAFMRLAREDDPQAFLRFAERFGVLGLQANGRPGNPDKEGCLPPAVVEDGVTWRVEPLAAWDVYARHARALLILAGALRQRVAALGPIDAGTVLRNARALNDVWVGQLPSDMRPLTVSHSVTSLARILNRVEKRGLTGNLERVAEHGIATQQQWLGNLLSQRWLAHSYLTPCVRWDDQKPTLDLDVTTFMGQSYEEGPWSPFALFSVLAGQLAAAFTNAGRYSECSECGVLYIPSGRRARTDRARFCSEECRTEGDRRRKRDAAARRRARERMSPDQPA